MTFSLDKGPLTIPLTQIDNQLTNEDADGNSFAYKLVVKLYTDNPPTPDPNQITDTEFGEGIAGQTVYIDFPTPATDGYNFYMTYNADSDGSSPNLIKINYRTDYLGSDTYTMFIWYMKDTSVTPPNYDIRYRSHLTSALPTDVCEGSTVGNIGLGTPADNQTFGIQFNVNMDSVGILIVGITDTDGGGSPM